MHLKIVKIEDNEEIILKIAGMKENDWKFMYLKIERMHLKKTQIDVFDENLFFVFLKYFLKFLHETLNKNDKLTIFLEI